MEQVNGSWPSRYLCGALTLASLGNLCDYISLPFTTKRKVLIPSVKLLVLLSLRPVMPCWDNPSGLGWRSLCRAFRCFPALETHLQSCVLRQKNIDTARSMDTIYRNPNVDMEVRVMPIFEYACKGCGKRFEKLQKSESAIPAACPACGSVEIEKEFSTFSSAGTTCQPTSSGGG
jgi:putative FmdB family regulatory protein